MDRLDIKERENPELSSEGRQYFLIRLVIPLALLAQGSQV